MTRVLCLTSWFPPHHFGGYELSCHDVMRRLAERGHHVEVLTSDHRHADTSDTDPAPISAVHRDLQLYFRDGALWSPSLVGRLRVERHNQRALRAALRRGRPDVVSVWHVGAMSLGLLATLIGERIPIVYAVSDDWPAYARQLDPWTRAVARLPVPPRLVEAITRVPATLPDLDGSGAFCFISEVTRHRSRRSSPWTFPTSTLVYSGIDGRLFAAGEPEDPDPLTPPLRLLYVGRVDPRKGIRSAVQALASLPGATLVVDGRSTAEDQATLEGWAAEAGVADRVTIQCSDRTDLPATYRSADVCLFTSEWEEPFGLVPLEAMACGIPVVASGVGGSGEFLVDGGNCVLFEPGDPASLAAAVQRLVDDPELVQHLVANGRISAEHFDVDHLTDVFEAWHSAVAAGQRDGLPADREPPPLAART
jgi:glycosyltransferase involved in cell wall biosynthesis